MAYHCHLIIEQYIIEGITGDDSSLLMNGVCIRQQWIYQYITFIRLLFLSLEGNQLRETTLFLGRKQISDITFVVFAMGLYLYQTETIGECSPKRNMELHKSAEKQDSFVKTSCTDTIMQRSHSLEGSYYSRQAIGLTY